MSSSPPPDRPETSVPHDDVYEPDADEEDTGPLHVPVATSPSDSWDPNPGQDTWAKRFDAPLTVSPRPARAPRSPNMLLGAVGAVVAVAAVGGLVFWLLRSSSDEPDPSGASPGMSASPPSASPTDEDEARLLRLLPAGYPSDSCEPAAPRKDALAQMNCGANTDPGGPSSATYTLARDRAALAGVFNDSIASANRVNCPGNIPDGVTVTKTPTANHGDEYSVTFTDAEVDAVLDGATPRRVNQLALAAIGAFASGLVAGALRLTADYVASREQFGKPLSTFQTVAAQLAEVYIASRTLTLAATSVLWRLTEGLDADDDINILGYWLASQAPPVMQLCHHLHGGMGMDIDYPMDRYYSSIKDLTRLVGGPSHRLDLVGAQCT